MSLAMIGLVVTVVTYRKTQWDLRVVLNVLYEEVPGVAVLHGFALRVGTGPYRKEGPGFVLFSPPNSFLELERKSDWNSNTAYNNRCPQFYQINGSGIDLVAFEKE